MVSKWSFSKLRKPRLAHITFFRKKDFRSTWKEISVRSILTAAETSNLTQQTDIDGVLETHPEETGDIDNICRYTKNVNELADDCEEDPLEDLSDLITDQTLRRHRQRRRFMEIRGENQVVRGGRHFNGLHY